MSTFMTGTTQQGIWNYVENGQTELVVQALQKDPKQLFYKQGHNEDSVLHVIAESSNTEMLKAVVAIIDPKDLETRNKAGNTAVMSSGVHGEAANADVLLAAGANPNAVNQQGESLLSKTVKGMNQDDVRPVERAQFMRIIETAIDKYGAKVDDKAIAMADTFEDDKTMTYLEGKRSAQTSAAFKGPVGATPGRAAPVVSKLG